MDHLVEQILFASSVAEDTNKEDISFQLVKLARSVRATKQTEVQIDSWADFKSWWEANRSQDLLFNLIDALGEDSPAIEDLKKIMEAQDKLDADLHQVYITLKGGKPSAPAPKEELPKETEESEKEEKNKKDKETLEQAVNSLK